MYVIYGECAFTTTKRRDDTHSDIVAYAAANGLTPLAWDRFPAGVVDATISGSPGLTVCYSGTSIAVVEQAEATANTFLQGRFYEGFVAHSESR